MGRLTDTLQAEDILPRLHTRWLGKTLVCTHQTDSTIKMMRMLELQGAPHGTVAAAEQQTAGRGRFNRKWESPPYAGLYFNILLRPEIPTEQAAHLTPAIAVGAAEGLRTLGFDAKIKWPNDIIIAGRKICGMLLEMGGDRNNLRFISAGVGINVNLQAEDFPEELRSKAGALCMFTKESLRRSDVLCSVLESIEPAVELCLTDYAALLEKYRALSITIGSEIVASGGADVRGRAVDINENGELIVLDTDGQTHVLRTGDVSVRGVMGYV